MSGARIAIEVGAGDLIRVPRGTHTLWHDGVAMARGVVVSGGEVAELDLRAAPSAA